MLPQSDPAFAVMQKTKNTIDPKVFMMSKQLWEALENQKEQIHKIQGSEYKRQPMPPDFIHPALDPAFSTSASAFLNSQPKPFRGSPLPQPLDPLSQLQQSGLSNIGNTPAPVQSNNGANMLNQMLGGR